MSSGNWLLRGGTNRDIASRLGKSHRTVEHQLQSIYRKFKSAFSIPVNTRLRRDMLVREFHEFFEASENR